MRLFEVKNAKKVRSGYSEYYEVIGYTDEDGLEKYKDYYLNHSSYEQDGYVPGKLLGFPEYKKVFVGGEVFSNKVKKQYIKKNN